MPQHTPGPWRLVRLEVAGVIFYSIEAEYPSGQNKYIARIAEGNSWVDGSYRLELPAEANGLLIAASPCLLEALKMVQTVITDKHHFIAADREQIWEAVAKATGGKQ